MHLQPNRNYISNDDVQTPPELARRIIDHFQPRGRILEPCAGEGNVLHALRAFVRQQSLVPGPLSLGPRAPRVQWCELKRGRDFLRYRKRVDWIVTNPPWSKFRDFLQQAMALADHVVFVVTVNHLWTRARIQDMATAGFGLREIVLLDTPATFPPMGFQLGAVYLARGWSGPVTLTDWTTEKKSFPRVSAAPAPVQRAPLEASPLRATPTWTEAEIAAFRTFHVAEQRRAA